MYRAVYGSPLPFGINEHILYANHQKVKKNNLSRSRKWEEQVVLFLVIMPYLLFVPELSDVAICANPDARRGELEDRP